MIKFKLHPVIHIPLPGEINEGDELSDDTLFEQPADAIIDNFFGSPHFLAQEAVAYSSILEKFRDDFLIEFVEGHGQFCFFCTTCQAYFLLFIYLLVNF